MDAKQQIFSSELYESPSSHEGIGREVGRVEGSKIET